MTIIARGKKGTLHGVFWVNGKAKWKSLKTSDRKEAELNYAKRLLEFQKKSKGVAFSILWERFKKEYQENYSRVEKRESTQGVDKWVLGLYAVICNIHESADITPESLELYKRERKGKVKDLTINRQLGLLKNMAKWGQREGYIDREHDFKSVTLLDALVKRRKFFERDEIVKLKETLKEVSLKHRLVVLAGLLSGMRSGEIVNLKVSHFDFDHNAIKITGLEGWQPKDDEERDLPLFAELAAVVQEWIKFRRLEPEEYVFTHEAGRWGGQRRMQVRYLRETLIATLEKAKLERATYYSLRHSYGTHMTEVVDIDTLRRFMGHADIRTTQNYLHAKKNAAQIAAQKPPF